MSRRGGGGGGRRSDSRHDQPSPSTGRGGGGRGGGGGGRGGGGGGGRGRGFGAAAGGSGSSSASASGSRPATDFPPLASASPSAPSSAASLSQRFDQSMTLQSSGRRAQPQAPPPPARVQPVTTESQASVSQPTKEPIKGEAEVPPSTSKAITFPKRPGYGTLGRKCVIRSNHFQVQVDDRDFYHYDVSSLLALVFYFDSVLLF